MNKFFQIVQKYIFPTIIVMFGVLFIYSLIVATPFGIFTRVFLHENGNLKTGMVINKMLEVSSESRDLTIYNFEFVRSFLVISIVGIIISLLPTVYRSQLRKKYYITNFVAIGLFIGYSIFTLIYGLIGVTKLHAGFNGLPFDDINAIPSFKKLNFGEVSINDAIYYYIGYVLFAILFILIILSTAVFVYKLICNIKNKNNVVKKEEVENA